MTPEEIALQEAENAAAEQAEAEAKAKAEAQPQNPLQSELDKIKQKGKGRTELEKAIYTKNQIDKRIRELKGETETPEEPDDDEDSPMTVGMYKKIQQETAVKTAIQMADDIQDEVERELVKYHISNSIKSTGSPAEDLRLSRAIVNAAKNAKILEELARKSKPKSYSSGSSADLEYKGEEPEFTQEELSYMQPPFSLTKAQILEARKKSR